MACSEQKWCGQLYFVRVKYLIFRELKYSCSKQSIIKHKIQTKEKKQPKTLPVCGVGNDSVGVYVCLWQEAADWYP